MTFADARRTAKAAMLGEFAAWSERTIQGLESTGLTREQACQTFNDRCDHEALTAVLNRKIGEMTRVLLDHRAPERLQ